MPGWLAPPAAVALALIIGGGSARADVCVVVNPVLELGCREGQAVPPPAPAQSAIAPGESEPVRRTSTEPRYDPRRLAITFKRRTSTATIRAAIARAGTTLEQAIPKINAYLVGVDPDRRAEALASLRASPSVASASQELLAEAFDTSPDDNDWPRQEGLRVVGFQKAWDVTQGSSRVIVAVVDTGVDGRHPDLRGALVPGYDFVNGDADPADDQGHGTAVAGVIAARSNNHEGVAGICWRCSVMPIKALDASGSGDDTLIAAGLVWATDHGAQVINLSLGGPGASQELSNAIGYAVGKGVIVVAAAGNSGTTTQFFPAADPRALSVAATTVADHRYSWSNFGPWVRLAAPGCNLAPVLGGGYSNFCGTSSATPLVTGLIALELSAEPAATAGQAEQALARAAVPLPELVQYGRIDAGKTLSLLRPARASVVFRGTIGPRARTRTYRVVVGPGELDAGLQFTGTRPLTLLLTPAGRTKTIARVAGTSPLQLRTSVSAGRFALRVTGVVKTAFVLSVSYERRRQP
jgi:subtilisin family serine protease